MTRAGGLPTVHRTRPAPIDAELPLELLFDEARAKPLVADALGEAPAELAIDYVRYKPATSCLVSYRLEDAGGRPSYAYARAALPPEPRLEIVAQQADRRIRGLRALAIPRERTSMLERLVREPDRATVEPGWGAWDVIRYKPERRAVLAGATTDGERYFVRLYPGKQGERTAAVVRALRGSTDCVGAIGRRLRYSQSYRALFTRAVPGSPLDAIPLAESRRGLASAAAADALRELHRCQASLVVGASWSPVESAANAVAGLGAIVPEARRQAQSLADEILPRLENSPAPPCLIHGDFDESQVLVDDAGKAHLIDFDEARAGDPMEDVASLAARLIGRAPTGQSGAAIRSAASFVEAYERAQGWRLPEEQLSAWIALSLLRMAVEPFRHFEPDWPRRCARILALAEKSLQGRIR